jgi:hypothetical protein
MRNLLRLAVFVLLAFGAAYGAHAQQSGNGADGGTTNPNEGGHPAAATGH